MTHTLAAVFDNRPDAERAQEELIKAGFGSGTIGLNDAATAAGAISSDDDDDSILGSIKHFFTGLLGREHGDPHVYAEAVHRGHIVLTLEAPSHDEAERAADIIEAFSPLDIDAHESVWRAGGWTGAEAMRSGMGMQQSNMGAQQSGSVQSAQQASELASQRQEMPQPASLSPQQIQPAQSQQGGQGQAAQQRAEPEPGTRAGERKPLGGEQRPLQRGGMRIYPRGQAGMPNEDTLSILRGDDMGERDDLYFRSHWQDTYAYTGGTFQEYEPAYRYGLTMAGSTLYHSRPWEEVETELRETWQHSYPESAWDKFRDAVREGWHRVTT